MRNSFVIREFQPSDADACFQIRVDAFLSKFYGHLGPNSITAAVNAYMPLDYIRMAKTMPVFVAADGREPIGFAVLKWSGIKEAEIFSLYVRLDRVGNGVGSGLVGTAENWLRESRPEIERMTASTAVPLLNQEFYEKIGFHRCGESRKDSPDGPVHVVHFAKNLMQEL
ncbi:MAG: GNAT family N-acetyltransferase [Desulfobacterales bacterium]|nr:GNAT family N-acetyltransferase [Desulfobacterales bacterium]MDD3081882.1 GNAT family N-acetyltransferase [Desulfobacterales bacterium]MDD3951550.1 GNAT family N-acetyltransferase [Desulfobacterales bacterium]MDD4463605.1 GNAT family N-acetyltransferase [Desulfobacterales bacterium]